MSTVVVSKPPVFVAVIVYVTGVVERTLGVPLITPVDESIDRPDGRFGEIDQVTTAPPLDVGVSGDIATPLVSIKELEL